MTYHLYMLIACQSVSVHFLCLWQSFIYTFLVSILCIFHIHSITYYSMSLVYLLSILLRYSCLSHILCLFLVIFFYLILDLFHIISCIMFFASFLYFHVHFPSCSSTVHVSYTFISRIFSHNLSYTVLYFYLHYYTFHIRHFYML